MMCTSCALSAHLDCCRLSNHLRKGNRQSVRVDAYNELDALAFSLRRRHYEVDAFVLQFHISLVHILDVKADLASPRELGSIATWRMNLRHSAPVKRVCSC